MNIKKFLYSTYTSLSGRKLFQYYKEFQQQSLCGIPPDITRKALVKLLLHCQKSVPYYANIMSQVGTGELLEQKPELYLQKLPLVTKDIIRNNFEQLKSRDLEQRQWYFETSGGSTGEPIKLIQAWEYFDKSMAIKFLYSYLVAGREIGDPEVLIWGSERDIFQTTMGWKAKLSGFLRNSKYMNAFQMTPERMRAFIQSLNRKPPKLIVAYAQAIYELAQFAEEEQTPILPQKAIITSATTLYPWMREKIESVFQCKVFNRYGSREVGDIACERPGYEGLWAAPWGNYIEIVDEDNNPLPAGVEGKILITNLNNFALPLIRYQIGDRGALSPDSNSEQILQQVSGRSADMFKTRDGTLVDGEYFTHLLYFKNWVQKFQAIQKDYSEIVFKIIKNPSDFQPNQEELNEIVAKCRLVMGNDCKVIFEFVNEIPPITSGKYRYTISEVS